MAPFSPLPIGYSPRSPKTYTHPRPFPHIFGQTLHVSVPFPTSSSISDSARGRDRSRGRDRDSASTPTATLQDPPPIICGPESKSWMACLALSCFLVVVWLAALPEGSASGRSLSALRAHQNMMASRGIHDLGDGIGAGLFWVMDDVDDIGEEAAPGPMVGYGTARHAGMEQPWRQEQDEHENEIEAARDPALEQGGDAMRGPAPAAVNDWKDAYASSSPAPMPRAVPPAERARASPSGAGEIANPSSEHIISARDTSISPTITPSPTPSFSLVRRAPAASSTSFDAPAYAEQPTAQKTDGPDDDDGASSASSPAPSDPAGSRKADRRRSRLRTNGHQ